MKKHLLCLFVYLLFCVKLYSQSIANVNPLTGAANVSIPLITIGCGQVSVPIGLSYTSGLKLSDVEGTAGIGWQLNTGGLVSRLVRGLPDDVTTDLAANSRVGWMSGLNTAAAAIGSFTIHNDGGVTCASEGLDNSYISTNFPHSYDTEPDIFTANAPGLSCQMVYDRAASKFVPIVHDDLVISYGVNSTTGLITSFTITNDKGIKYIFSQCQTVRDSTIAGATAPTFFTTQYNQFVNGIDYTDGWYLTSMTDAVGNSVTLTYWNGGSKDNRTPVSLYMPGDTTATLQYTVKQTVTIPLLSSITTNNTNATNQNLTFSWGGIRTGQYCINSITGMGKNFSFTYKDLPSIFDYNYSRRFLQSLTDVGCSTPVNYQFSYAGEGIGGTGSTVITLFPDPADGKVDYWGYPVYGTAQFSSTKVWVNPSNSSYQRYAIYNSSTGGGSYTYSTTNGSDRNPELTDFNIANLIGITYVNGGTSTIEYEPNSYLDQPSTQAVNGGGIRVKKITDYDGIDAARNIVRNFSYDDPTTHLTSGKPVSLPVFAFTIPYSGAATGSGLWGHNTVLSDIDLSDEDHSIMYQYFTVSQTGAGSTQYQYYLPATNWDTGATPGCSGCSTTEWTPTLSYIARVSCSSMYGPLNNSINAYPFIPNANYDFERGLLQKVTAFNDAGTKVSETSYTYQRSSSPSIITAFKYDDLPNGFVHATAYNKYSIFYNTGELTSTVTTKVYDSATQSQAQSSTTSYVYGSSQHTLLTKQSVVNGDNSISSTNFRYIKDYSASAGVNPNVNAIYHLQQQNVNVPVETWREVTRGGVTKTIASSLTLFKDYTIGSTTQYLPTRQLSFVQPNGTTGFTPYSISGQTSVADPLYIPGTNYVTYDGLGAPQTVDDGNKNIKTVVTDHSTNHATATFGNAAYNEIGFSDFDTDVTLPQACDFTVTGSGSFTASGSHTGNAYGLGTGQTISKTITARNTLVNNYIFSIWIKGAAAGTLSFTLSDGTTSTTDSKSYIAGGWSYYEKKLAVGTFGPNVTLSVTSSQAISIDDVLLYPEIARVNTSSYDAQTGYMTSQTNTNGVSTYYQKDKWGRLLFQLDQDKNIVKKISYFTPNETALTLSPSSTGILSVPVSTPSSFSAPGEPPCLADITYTWDFGDGSPTISVFNADPQTHTYTSIGTYSLTITASHPTLGSRTYTQVTSVYPPPLTPVVCQSGVLIWSNFTNAATRITTCGTNPSDAFNSYFTVTSVGGSGYGTLTYTWQISYNNGSTWNTYDTGSQITVPCSSTNVSYKMRCVVTSSVGQTGTSSTLQFSAL